jgi:hypothetical protein
MFRTGEWHDEEDAQTLLRDLGHHHASFDTYDDCHDGAVQ